MKNNRNIITVIIIVLVVVAAITIVAWYMARPRQIMLQGEAVAQTYKVSSKLVGRVDSLTVKLGDKVVKGQFMFELSTPEIDAKLRQAEAMLTAAGARNEMAKEGLRPQEIDAIMNMWHKAEAGLDLAKSTYNRAKNLYNEGVISAQKFDEASANLKAMQSTVNAAKAQYIMATEGARKEDKRAAAALVAQASGGVSEVEAYLKDAVQYSPIDGEVSSVMAEKGELVNAGFPVISLVDLNDIWFSFNIKESYLPYIRENQLIKVYVPALAKIIEVKVSYMAVQAQYATWTATRADGEFDIRTFEVRMRPTSKVEGLRPGMTILFDWNKL